MSQSHDDNPVASTLCGDVRGCIEQGVMVFKDIPYAAPPFGENLLRPPMPPQAWSGVLDGTQHRATCPQLEVPGLFNELSSPKFPAGEDCLNLTVYTPDINAKDLPVYVWIHGGGYFIGCSSDAVYHGGSFAKNGVILVAINYRLGPFGYLHFEDLFPELEGSDNLGMRDQIAALAWVRDNIAAFGGDPDSVTIGGESAGGMAVNALLASPSAAPFYARAIPQSPAFPNEHSRDEANLVMSQFLKKLGVAPGDTDALLSQSIDAFVGAGQAMYLELMAGQGAEYGLRPSVSVMPFQPTYGTSILPLPHDQALCAGSAKGKDLMIGFTKEENRIFLADMAESSPDSLLTPEMQEGLLPFLVGEKAGEVAELYREEYKDRGELSHMSALRSDWMFNAGALMVADRQSAQTENVWVYRFDWPSPLNDGQRGAHHFLDVPFTFNQIDTWQAEAFVGDADCAAFAQTVHAHWVAFIKTGDPNTGSGPHWPAFDPEKGGAYILDEQARVVDWPLKPEIRDLWLESTVYQAA